MPSNLKQLKLLIRPMIALVMLFCLTFMLASSSFTTAYADDGVREQNTKLNEAFTSDQHGEFKLENRYYYIDSISDQDAEKLEKNGILDEIRDAIFGWADIGGKLTDKINYMLNSFVNIMFQFNVFMTKVMLICLEYGYKFEVVNDLIDELGKLMPQITGISSSGTLMSGGIFGHLMQFVVIITAAYTLYIYAFKRAFIASMATVLKTVVLLALAFFVFSDYASFLKTANNISSEISTYIVNVPTNNTNNNSNNSGYQPDTTHDLTSGFDGNSLAKMQDTLWSMFVDRPYLYLQYGTHDIDEIGRDRIESLMRMKPGEDRYNYVLQNEIANEKNTLMLNSSVTDKVAFTPFYVVINGVVSFPIFLLAVFLVVLQFWFLIIAGIGPFALIIGVIPGFNGVFKRYVIELVIPLALKIFFSFFAMFILVLSGVLFNLNFGSGNSIKTYVGIAFLNFILFVTIFLLRKRIGDIFVSGSQIISGLRDATGTLTEPIKKGVETAGVVGGAAVGAMVAGPQGAMMGASIGGTAGRTLTGEAGAAEIANTAARTANYAQLRAATDKFGEQNLSNQLSDDKKMMVTDFMKEKGFDDETVNDVISGFEKNGILDVSERELKSQFGKMSEKAKSEGLNKDVASELVGGIKQTREDDKLRSQLKTLNVEEGELPKRTSMTSENVVSFFHNKGFDVQSNEMMSNVINTLEKNGLTDVTQEEMATQFNKLEEQYNDGKLKEEFPDAFAQGIIRERKIEERNARHAEVFADKSSRVQPFGPQSFSNNESESLTRNYESSNSGQQPVTENNDLTRMYEPNNTSNQSSTVINTPPTAAKSDLKNVYEPNTLNENPNIGGNSVESPHMNSNTFEKQNIKTHSELASSTVKAQEFENNDLTGKEVQAGSLETQQRMEGASFGGQKMEQSSLEGHEFNHSPIENNSMGSSPLENQGLNGDSLEIKDIESGSLDSAQVKNNDSSNKQNSSQKINKVYEDPILNVRHNHASNSYKKSQEISNELKDDRQSNEGSNNNDSTNVD